MFVGWIGGCIPGCRNKTPRVAAKACCGPLFLTFEWVGTSGVCARTNRYLLLELFNDWVQVQGMAPLICLVR